MTPPLPIIAGNWKMNLTWQEAKFLLQAIQRRFNPKLPLQMVVAPPFPFLALAHELLSPNGACVGGQNLSSFESGAYTGETSASMLASIGASHVIIGHSERRQHFGETDALVHQKTALALKHGLTPIVCVGESLQEHESGRTLEVVSQQFQAALEGVDATKVVVAYEPVWAIGTGKVASEEVVGKVHAHLRSLSKQMNALKLPLLYGGSVKPDNARALSKVPEVNGVLVGGASLSVDSFFDIIDAFCPASDPS